jgi:hypothetical protein
MKSASEEPLSKSAQDTAFQFAIDALQRVPKDNPEALEAHITGVLVLFWGALWGTFGTDYARDFIAAQLRSMEKPEQADRFTPPRIQ